MNAAGYEAINERRTRLASTLTALTELCRQLDAAPRADALERIKRTLEADSFKLLVVGEFKRGKSTLINAMLGCDVLPAKVAPCTAVITRIRYGDHKKAMLHFKDENRAALEIDAEDLKRYVTIQATDDMDDNDDDGSEGVNRSPYRAAEVFYPLQLLRNQVEVVDSPGLNEHQTRTEVTREFLMEADAMVMVLSCQQALSQSELQFVREQQKGRDLSDVFFLWNHYDIIQESPDDIEDIRNRSRKYLEPLVGARPRIFFISARAALQARKNNRPDLAESSNLVRFEGALEEFLSKERGRVKLRSPLVAAEDAVRDIQGVLIPERKNLLARPVKELRQQYERQQPRLEKVERQGAEMVRSVERRRDIVVQEVEASYRTLVSKVDSGLPQQAESVPIGAWQAMWQSGQAKKQVVDQLQTWIRAEVEEWKDGALARLLDRHMKQMDEDLNARASEFLKGLKSVRSAFSLSVPDQIDNAQDVTPISRVVGAVGGLVIGGIGSAMEGASLGMAQMAKGLGLQVGVCAVMIVMGFGLPVVIPTLAALGAIRALLGGKSKAEQLRAAIVQKLVEGMRSQQGRAEKQLRDDIQAHFDRFLDRVSTGVRIKVNEVRGQVEAVLRKLEQHEGAAREEVARLLQVEQELATHAATLRQLRSEMESC